MNKPTNAKFTSPSALREYALETASELRRLGLAEAGGIMESAATFVTGSGWEWLRQLGAAAANIRKRFALLEPVTVRIKRIQQAATSRRPYG